MAYQDYDEWLLAIYDAILNRIRSNTVVKNHGFKGIELIGDGREPEGAGMPLCRLMPGADNIQRLETCTRNHFLECEVIVWNHTVDQGEQCFRDHTRVFGAVYDTFSRRDTEDPTLGGLVEEMQIRQTRPKIQGGSKGITFTSTMHMSILSVKVDE